MNIERKRFTTDEVEELIGNLAGDLLAMARRDDKTIKFSVTEDNRLRAETHKVLAESGVVQFAVSRSLYVSKLVL